jgi:hypothetical protein
MLATVPRWQQHGYTPLSTTDISELKPSGNTKQGILKRLAARVTERSNAATEERLKSGHAVGGLSIV